ncbi:ABC transporter substrate-binding protein [Paenibacillaceae bacterium WGS1546]|uniref:ABC transporter substrate-binding protein n=1 Tax=Cohnella sp. WGS1546 TaxID=3366810 RepID=UPI00372CF390
MNLHVHAMSWSYAALQLLDVGRYVLRPGENANAYRLQNGEFLYAFRGKAGIRIDGTAYAANCDFVCHAGCGASVEIVPIEGPFEYYRVGYLAVAVEPGSGQPTPLRRSVEPFGLHYGFAPRNPVPLRMSVEQMHRQWTQAGTLRRLQAKALFHQFAYEALRELLERESAAETADPVRSAVRYIGEHYAEPLTLDSIASVPGCTGRQLQRFFKDKLLIGPIEYLIRLRLSKAKTLLCETDVPLKQIAEAVGYADSYHFSRLFKKHEGVSPGRYREWAKCADDRDRRQYSLRLSRNTIVAGKSGRYSGFEDKMRHSRTIAHLRGELRLERKPEKIVVLDYQYLDHLAALGEIPAGSVVGTSDRSAFPAYLADRTGGVKVVGTKEAPDLKAIIEAGPDLIVCTVFQEALYDRLSMIAPTLLFDRNEDWRSALLKFGRIVDKEREARLLLDRHDRRLAKLHKTLADRLAGKTVALIRPRDRIIRLHTTAHRTAEVLYRDLGLAAPRMTVGKEKTSFPLPLEAMTDLDADHLFVLEDDSNGELADEFRSTPTWHGLEAVRRNRVYTANTTLWVGYYGPIAIGRVLDEVAAALLRRAT